MPKSQSPREQTIGVGLSNRKVEQRLNAELFLDEYPRWYLEAPHCSIILHAMFLHAAKQGRRRQRGLSDDATAAAYKGLTQPRPTHHEACGVPDITPGDQGSLSQCLPVDKVA